jgi:hypothetical protein
MIDPSFAVFMAGYIAGFISGAALACAILYTAAKALRKPYG